MVHWCGMWWELHMKDLLYISVRRGRGQASRFTRSFVCMQKRNIWIYKAHGRACVNRRVRNQRCCPQQHPLWNGNTESLCIYDIPLSAFLLPPAELFFALLEGFFVLLTCPGRRQHTRKESKQEPTGGREHTLICSMIMYICIKDI